MTFNIHLLIDRSPELPYFILALVYLFTTPTAESTKTLSTALLFIITCLVVGLLLKSCFKTKRPRKWYNLPALKYDFPSLHSMISIGTTAFAYYVNPLYTAVLTPVGLFYLYSRIKLKAHSVTGVIGGAVIGIVLGLLFGASLTAIKLPYTLELFLTMMLFCTPLMTAIFRIKYAKGNSSQTPDVMDEAGRDY